MARLPTPLITLLFLVLVYYPILVVSTKVSTFEKVRYFDDKMVPNPPLWTRTSRSEGFTECARMCSKHTKCASFFYNSVTRQCRGMEFLLYPSATTPEVGSEYYAYLNDCKSTVSMLPPSLVVKNAFVCDRFTDGGGWLVFQRRIDGSVNFLTGWNDYKQGFGSPDSEFWLGNDILSSLTSQRAFELRIDMTDWNLDTAFAVYQTFTVASEEEYYRLEVGNFTGDQGDSFIAQNGANFTTIDNDNDQHEFEYNCAVEFTGAWWYYTCHESNLNGLYNNNEYGKGIIWSTWKGFDESLKSTEMKIRPLE